MLALVHHFIMHFENYLSAVVSEDADIFLDYQSDFEHIFIFSCGKADNSS